MPGGGSGHRGDAGGWPGLPAYFSDRPLRWASAEKARTGPLPSVLPCRRGGLARRAVRCGRPARGVPRSGDFPARPAHSRRPEPGVSDHCRTGRGFHTSSDGYRPGQVMAHPPNSCPGRVRPRRPAVEERAPQADAAPRREGDPQSPQTLTTRRRGSRKRRDSPARPAFGGGLNPGACDLVVLVCRSAVARAGLPGRLGAGPRSRRRSGIRQRRRCEWREAPGFRGRVERFDRRIGAFRSASGTGGAGFLSGFRNCHSCSVECLP